MIFIALFLFIALNVIALNMYNDSNLEEIENHIKNQECTNVVYSKGSYKSLCEDKVLEIENSFIVDLEKNSKVYMYKDIKNIDIQKLHVLINDKDKIEFKQKDDLYEFYDNLKEKITSR